MTLPCIYPPQTRSKTNPPADHAGPGSEIPQTPAPEASPVGRTAGPGRHHGPFGLLGVGFGRSAGPRGQGGRAPSMNARARSDRRRLLARARCAEQGDQAAGPYPPEALRRLRARQTRVGADGDSGARGRAAGRPASARCRAAGRSGPGSCHRRSALAGSSVRAMAVHPSAWRGPAFSACDPSAGPPRSRGQPAWPHRAGRPAERLARSAEKPSQPAAHPADHGR